MHLDRKYGKSKYIVLKGRTKHKARRTHDILGGESSETLESAASAALGEVSGAEPEEVEIQKQIIEERRAKQLQARKYSILTDQVSVPDPADQSLHANPHKHSKVWDRVKASNRRVRKVNWGQSLKDVVRQEQFQNVLGEHRRRSQLLLDDFTFVEDHMIRTKAKEKIFYGAKVVLQCKSDEIYLGIDGSLGTQPGRFFLINLDDPRSTSPVYYGERVGLLTHNGQKALGTKLKLSSDGLRITMVPNDERALFTAKWKLIDPDDVSASTISQRTKKTLSHGDVFGLKHNDFTMVIRKGQLLVENKEPDHLRHHRHPSQPSQHRHGESKGGPARSVVDAGAEAQPEHAFDTGALWQVHLYANASAKKVPTAQRVLMRAQSQIRSVKERLEDQRAFAQTLRREMKTFAARSDVHYLVHDPTSLVSFSQSDVQSYYLRRLEQGFSTHAEAESYVGHARESPGLRTERDGAEKVTPSKRAFVLPTLTPVERAKAVALAHRAEALVPAVVWQQVRAQEALLLSNERERRAQAAQRIQVAFRKWKQGQWTRLFQSMDLRCKAHITTRAETQMPMFRTSSETEGRVFQKPHFVQDDGSQLHWRRRHQPHPEGLGRSKSASHVKRPGREENSLEHIDYGESSIEQHFHILRHSNPALFAEVPTCLKRPVTPAISNQNTLLLRDDCGSRDDKATVATRNNQVLDQAQEAAMKEPTPKLARCKSAKLPSKRFSSSAAKLGRPHSAAQLSPKRAPVRVLEADLAADWGQHS